MDRTYYGVHRALEDLADEILRQAVAALPRSEKLDVLTPWKERDRLSREVYTAEGVPDAALRSGMYHRAWNPGSPHLNSQDGHARTPRDVGGVYVSEAGYQDRAGKVYSGRIRAQADCRSVSWGRVRRLQCRQCCRYLPGGDEAACGKCGTIYLSEELFTHV